MTNVLAGLLATAMLLGISLEGAWATEAGGTSGIPNHVKVAQALDVKGCVEPRLFRNLAEANAGTVSSAQVSVPRKKPCPFASDIESGWQTAHLGYDQRASPHSTVGTPIVLPMSADESLARRPSKMTVNVGSPVELQTSEVVITLSSGPIRSVEVSSAGQARIITPGQAQIQGRKAVVPVTWQLAGDFTLLVRVVPKKGKPVSRDVNVQVSRIVSDRLQLVYWLPAGTEPVPGRVQAISNMSKTVQGWFAGQMGGLAPRFTTDAAGMPSVVIVQSDQGTSEMANEIDDSSRLHARVKTWKYDQTIPRESTPIIFIEGSQTPAEARNACGWTGREIGGWAIESTHIAIPMGNCNIYPSDVAVPYGGTYLLVHEMTHLLGAVSNLAPHHTSNGHVSDDSRDVLYVGPNARDWSSLMLDPGHDDYYLTGRADLVNIENSPLLFRP